MTKFQDWIIIERLGDVILKHVEGHIFEIGAGRSTPILGKLAKDFDRNFYCFEKREDRCNQAREFGGTVFQGKSLDNIGKLSETTIAMGLIDGMHTAATVRAEISFFLKRLSVGGVIFLHDTYRSTSLLLHPNSNSDRRCLQS